MTTKTIEWKVGDYAYKGYERVQIKEMLRTEVCEVSDGSFTMSGAYLEEVLFPDTPANKLVAETIQRYWNLLRNARGSIALNHPDLHRKFEEFAWQAMALPAHCNKTPILEAARKFQQECMKKLLEMVNMQVDGVYIFNGK